MAQIEARPVVGVGAAMRMLRFWRGWSLRELEERTGIPEASLARYERGGTSPTLDRTEAIAQAFGLSTPELLEIAQGLAELVAKYPAMGLYLNLAPAVA